MSWLLQQILDLPRDSFHTVCSLTQEFVLVFFKADIILLGPRNTTQLQESIKKMFENFSPNTIGYFHKTKCNIKWGICKNVFA